MIPSVIIIGMIIFFNEDYIHASNSGEPTSDTFRMENKTECKMYQKHCFIKITSSFLLTFSKVKPEKSKIFEYKSIKKCSINDTKLKDCSKFKNFISSNKKLYLLDIKPKLVGRALLEFEYLIDNSSIVATKIHNIVIKSPKRFIDIFQLAYISFVSVLVSVIMGILLDLDSLIQIIKMPIPVLIGFLAQYLFMPLVRILVFQIIYISNYYCY